MYKDIGPYVMEYEDFNEMSRKTWRENFTFPCIDMVKNEDEGKYRILKDTFIECICQSEAL